MQVYQELAQIFERAGDPQRRDVFLALSADAAYADGNTDEAESHFRQLLSNSPHHFLGGYASFAEAQSLPDGQMYLDDLRRQYPVLKAHQLLQKQRDKERAARPPSESGQDLDENYRQTAKRPTQRRPIVDDEPLAQTQPEEDLGLTVPFVRPDRDSGSPAEGTLFPTSETRQDDSNPPSPQTQPTVNEPLRPSPPIQGSLPEYLPTISEPVRSTPPQPINRSAKRRPPQPGGKQQPAFGSAGPFQPVHPQRPPSPPPEEVEAEIDEDSELWRGEWLSVAFFVVLALATVGLFYYTFLRPLF